MFLYGTLVAFIKRQVQPKKKILNSGIYPEFSVIKNNNNNNSGINPEYSVINRKIIIQIVAYSFHEKSMPLFELI